MISYKNVIKTLEYFFKSDLPKIWEINDVNNFEFREKIQKYLTERLRIFVNGGLILKFNIICNESNNTDQYRDCNMCVFDTIIYFNSDLSYNMRTWFGINSFCVEIETKSICNNEEAEINDDRQKKLEEIL